MASIRTQALGYLRNGRVTVHRAGGPGNGRPTTVRANVFGANATYHVGLEAGGWLCTCQERTGCRHIASVQMVTGHPSAAARDGQS